MGTIILSETPGHKLIRPLTVDRERREGQRTSAKIIERESTHTCSPSEPARAPSPSLSLLGTSLTMRQRASARLPLMLGPSVVVGRACRVCFLPMAAALLCLVALSSGRGAAVAAATRSAAGTNSRHNNNWAVLVRQWMSWWIWIDCSSRIHMHANSSQACQ